MAVTQTLDLTNKFNADGAVSFDRSGWDTVIIQIVTNSATINFSSSNDGGAITGSAEGNARSAKNFIATQGENLATGTAATSLANGTGALFRFGIVGKYMKLSGGGTVASILVLLSKIG